MKNLIDKLKVPAFLSNRIADKKSAERVSSSAIGLLVQLGRGHSGNQPGNPMITVFSFHLLKRCFSH